MSGLWTLNEQLNEYIQSMKIYLYYRQGNSKNNLFNTKYFDSVVVVFSLRISAIRDFFFFLENKWRQYPILPISFVSSERICAVMQRQMPKARSVFTFTFCSLMNWLDLKTSSRALRSCSLQIVCVLFTGSPSWFKTEIFIILRRVCLYHWLQNYGKWFTFPLIITLFYLKISLFSFSFLLQ